MKVVFRVDASTDIGSGHVMRCLVLAKELSERGGHVEFACLPTQGNMNAYIGEQGFSVLELTMPLKPSTSCAESEYAAWLLRSPQEDAEDFIGKVAEVDLVVTDHYAIDAEWQRKVRSALQCKLVAIDDLVRVHDADIVIDQTLGRQPSDYANVPRVLAGSDYALLNPLFNMRREQAVSRVAPSKPLNVLVSMGGVDKSNATLRVLETIANESSFSIRVLLSPRAPHYQTVKAFCDGHSHIEHSDFEADMSALMLRSDIAIGAPGTTSWERACLGLPNIIIPIADNQSEISRQLVARNASICIALSDVKQSLKSAIDKIGNEWTYYQKNNLALCDGLGVNRVATEIEVILANQASAISLVKAEKSDISLVFEWQCHPTTRRFAHNRNIPTLEEHTGWMSKKLVSPNDYFYIMLNSSDQKVGVVRLDRIGEQTYLLSVYVSPDAHGQGYAYSALQQLDKLHPRSTITAQVLEQNVASQKLFEKLGYIRIDSENFTRKPIK